MREVEVGACLRALNGLRDAELARGESASNKVLDAFATYVDEDGFSEAACQELGAAWPKFDRALFAKRMFGESLYFGTAGYLPSIEGIDAAGRLTTLAIAVGAGCNIDPLPRCTKLVSLDLSTDGPVDLTPIARIDLLSRLDLRGQHNRSLQGLTGARFHNAHLEISHHAALDFLLDLPRAKRIRIVSDRTELSAGDCEVLSKVVERGIAICAYGHESWSADLRKIGGQLTEAVGYRAVGHENFRTTLELNAFI
jgi:hypothetical protein